MNVTDKADDPYEELTNTMLQFTEIEGVTEVLETYLKLHEGRIGAHWLWCAMERIARGEREFDVLWDYGYVYSDEILEDEGACPVNKGFATQMEIHSKGLQNA